MSSLIENAFRTLAGRDADRISAVLTEDAEWLSPPGNATAQALRVTHHLVGRDTIARFFAEDLPHLFERTSASPSTGSTPTASGRPWRRP
ncbi:hypothetical protein GCM10018785_41850 [Streptomyces longispororuber]|uniref:SnoaL-like domain-containing protein n=1 Tax=Streptomyces longispororuber TaxID=68230 RepID=A0A918ZSR6_9ACTN|nr:hypothetical protein GCM10018785_41850 [Streptomyces longispororuber]